MLGSPNDRTRRGIGVVFAFVIWVVTIALVFAMMQAGAQHGAIGGATRTQALRVLLFAGESALIEAASTIRRACESSSGVMKRVYAGATSGDAHDPNASRAAYQAMTDAGLLSIGPVRFETKSRLHDPAFPDGLLIDLLVRVECAAGGQRTARTLRRRYAAKILIAMALATAVISGAIMLYSFSNRSMGVTASSRALQTATFVEEIVTADLHRVAPSKGGPLRFYPDKPSRLGFYVYDPASQDGATIGIRAVQYLVNDKQHLVREFDSRLEPVGVSPITSIEFFPFTCATGTRVRVNMAVGREKDEPAGPPMIHSFVVRLSKPRALPVVDTKLISDFQKTEDKPTGQRLPRID